MKALVAIKKNDVRFTEIDKPKIYKSEEVLIKIKGSGICGSDSIFFNDKEDFSWVRYPVVIGHEFAGVVEEVGKDVVKIKEGDHVVVENYIRCGRCWYCKTGKYFLCDNHGEYGFTQNGGFSEYCTINQNNLIKIPKNIDFKYSGIIENIATALRACRKTKLKFGSKVLVFGAGPLGTLIALISKSLGAEVVVVSTGEARLKRLRQMDLYEVLNVRKIDIKSWVIDNTNGKGIDIIFDTSGSSEPILYSSQIIKKAGKIIIMGITGRKLCEIDYDNLVLKEVEIIGSVSGMGYFEEAVKTIQKNIIDLDMLITHSFKLCDIFTAFKYESERIEGAIKVVILQ